MKMLYKWTYKIPGLSLNVVFFLLGPYNLWPGFTPLCGWAILCCAYIWPHLSIQLPYDIIDICIFIFWSLCPVLLWIIIHKLLLKFNFFSSFFREILRSVISVWLWETEKLSISKNELSFILNYPSTHSTPFWW